MVQRMSTQPSLLDLFTDKNGGLGVFRRQVANNVLEHLSGNSIFCEPKQQANGFVDFTEQFADVDLTIADIPANRSGIISRIRNQALTILQEKSIESLAKPYFDVRVQRDASVEGFAVTVSLGFFNSDKQA
jgi:hypothetical protein